MSWAAMASKAPVPLTPEQVAERERQRFLAEQGGLHQKAAGLLAAIEACIAGSVHGTSPNYPNDRQYTLPGKHPEGIVNMAFQLWSEQYSGLIGPLRREQTRKAETIGGVHLHRMLPAPKFTGGRNGQVQTNFIRDIGGGAPGRHNVHINVG